MNIRRITSALVLGAGLVSHEMARGAVSFTFNPDAGTPQTVIDGFNLAANNWSAWLANNITVNLDIGFAPMASGVLGQTTYSFVQSDYTAVLGALRQSAGSADDIAAYARLQTGPNYTRLINRTTDNPNGAGSPAPYVNSLAPISMTRPNARALGLVGGPIGSDAAIRFNSMLPFDFDPSDGTTPGQFDFVTVAAHEIGHALGFASVVNQLEQSGGAAGSLPATVFDLFRFSAASVAQGRGVIDTASDGRDKYFSLDGGLTSIAGLASGVNGSGYTADHWREFTFTGLMDPQTFAGLRRQISPTDLRAFDVIGFSIPEPTGASLAIAVAVAGLMRGRRRGN